MLFVDDAGNVQYHCTATPDCPYHNCGAWVDVRCGHKGHETPQALPPGQSISVHVTHEQCQWISSNHIALPPCPGCGSHMTVRIHSEEEKLPPRILCDEQTGAILQVAHHPKANPNLTAIVKEVKTVKVPHAAFRDLAPDHLAQLISAMQSLGAKDTSWMTTEVPVEVIQSVTHPRPHVVQHERLAAAMHAHGKHPVVDGQQGTVASA
jgi:hypothetical protein